MEGLRGQCSSSKNESINCNRNESINCNEKGDVMELCELIILFEESNLFNPCLSTEKHLILCIFGGKGKDS